MSVAAFAPPVEASFPPAVVVDLFNNVEQAMDTAPDRIRQERAEVERTYDVAQAAGTILLDTVVEERPALPVHERPLTEIDNLNRLRRPDGSHDPTVLAAIHANLIPRVKEPAMPFAVSRVYQERKGGAYWWLDQTGQQVAASGRRYHKHEAALARVDVEELEAVDLDENLRPGYTRILLSPKMNETDAPRDVAKAEHLADDDMVRIHRADTDAAGNIRGKFMDSLLVRDVPLSAWARMLSDPKNTLLAAPVRIDNPESALSVMRSTVGLEVPEDALPEGVVSLLEAVIPYIADQSAQQKAIAHLKEFRVNQQLMHEVAVSTASDWLNFEVSLADSLHAEFAEPAIEQFIEDLKDQWAEQDLALFAKHRISDGRLYMTRELALRLEEAKQNVLWAEAAVAVNNRRVTRQMSAEALERIRANQATISRLRAEGGDPRRVAALKADNARVAAAENVTVEGGCPGGGSGNFKKKDEGAKADKQETKDDTKKSKEKSKKREWMYCVNCPLCKRDDVNAYIDYFETKKRITCCSCKGHKEYDN